MGRALEDFHIEGLGQNIPFLAAVMDQERFRSGKLSTNYIKDEFPDGFHGPAAHRLPARPDGRRGRCAMHRTLTAPRRAASRLRDDWMVVDGGEKRAGAAVRRRRRAATSTPRARAARCSLDGHRLAAGPADRSAAALDGDAFTAAVKPAAEGFVIRHRAASAARAGADRRARPSCTRSCRPRRPPTPPRWCSRPCRAWWSPSTSTVGQQVQAGEAVAVIEAMKMQNIIRAERDGVVKAVSAKAGDSVAADEVLVEFQ